MVEKSELIRSDIEQTRVQMGDTLDALGCKANVPARAKGWMGGKKDAVTGACSSQISKVSGATDSMVSRVSGITPSGVEIQARAGRRVGPLREVVRPVFDALDATDPHHRPPGHGIARSLRGRSAR